MKTLSIFLALGLGACATSPSPRDPASESPQGSEGQVLDLSGDYLGEAFYKLGHRGHNRPAIRLFLSQVEGGAYSAVLYEYPWLQGIAPQYLAARKAPDLNPVVGYLNNIASKISAFRVVPGAKPGTLEMYALRVVGNSIEAEQEPARLITLSDKATAQNALAGATISFAGKRPSDGEEIYFPAANDGKLAGFQYTLARTTYEKAKLNSTWRTRHLTKAKPYIKRTDTFLTGNYLAAYGKLDDVALKLSSSSGVDRAVFINNAAKFPKENRAKIFTSPLSAPLEGSYVAIEPIDGMFLLSPEGNGPHPHAENVAGRIGLYIDVFDATVSLSQDVVELAFVNPNDPSDFLMYYEHPDNGEGTSE